MNKSYLFLLLLGGVMLLSACAEHNMELEIHNDDSGEFTMDVEVDLSDVPFGKSQIRQQLVNGQEELQKEGFQTTLEDEEDRLYMEASRSFDSLTEADTNELLNEGTDSILLEEVSETKRVLDVPFEGEGDEMAGSMIESTLTVNFPTTPEEHNAHKADGSELTWYIDLAEGTDVYAEYEVQQGSTVGIIVVTGLVVILAGVAAYFVFRRKRNVTKTPDSPSGE
ncbi:hypothetical protein [Salibacterium qingdaonense]|uniref:LPXTG-motif cell wall anchor domain-containing protein n=1 Tax=Salibacterium qingdaonense TaxID=266892 RepID=A0A1I4P6T3_9BACI|nr:hypothetical protein [Salibacterium qingdaonense]SFM23429.1 hypothetical protein SAMN04488054_12342 [Salibacterium qingdaonense]